ncbi:MAG TPA: hypothetical protein VKD70_08335, partial [Candidatus Acidoferrum sp.]|nr:hypothetical protein [Candidatus Acidoferrum sp.]
LAQGLLFLISLTSLFLLKVCHFWKNEQASREPVQVVCAGFDRCASGPAFHVSASLLVQELEDAA